MRVFLTAILFSIALGSAGQADFRLDSCRQSLDSLYQKLSGLAALVRESDKNIAVSPMSYNSQIRKFGNDSSVVLFLDSSGKLLFQILNRYDEKGCRWWYVRRVFGISGKLCYWEAEKWSCLKPHERIDPDVKYFAAILYERGRLKYDSLGRLKEEVWWYAPLGAVRKYTFIYDSNNVQTYNFTKLDYNLFWE